MHQEVLTQDSAKLFPKLKQFSGFYLAGGTALALQIGHRISVDFDLFGSNEINKDLLPKVEKIFSESVVAPLVNNPDELSVLINRVKITFLKYPFPIVNAFVDLEGIKALGILELAATKAYTIGRRGAFKDYVDLYYILSDKLAKLEQIIDLAEKKFGIEFNSRIFLEQLIYFDDIDDEAIIFFKEHITKTQLEHFFIKEVRSFKL